MLPSHPLHGLLSAFDAGGSNYAVGTPDGRVRTYDTVTGRLRSTLSSSAKGPELAAGGNLAEGYTCLSWVDEGAGGARATTARSWLAAGTSSGAVKLYDTATGGLRWQAAGCNEGGTTCLAFAPGRSSVLLSSGRDGQVCVLDTASGRRQAGLKGSKHAVSAAALSQDGSQLIIGGSTLSVWDMDSQQRVAKFAGHPLPVRALAFAPGGAFALSAADGERLVAVWPTPDRSSSSSKKKKSSSSVAAASLAVEHPVVGLRTLAADGEPAGSFYAAATTEAGQVVVWVMRPASHGGIEATQIARVAVGPGADGSSSDEVILAAALEPAAAGAVSLLLVAGSPAKPRFVRLPLRSTSSSKKVTYVQPSAADSLIRPAAAAAAGQQQAAAAGGPADVEMLGADNAGEAVQLRAAAGRKREAPEPDGAAAAAAGDSDDEDDLEEEDDDAAGEQTLGGRVAQLEQQQQQQQQQPDAAADVAGDAAAALPAGPIKADSLAVLMSQALRSSDKLLLERCLAVSSERVVANTVRRLVPLDAALLLRAAVARLQSSPRRGQQLVVWIQAVLLAHTAYLMSAPGAAPLVSSLFQIIESRLAMHRQLLSLAGRLDLLLAQGSGGAGAGGGGTGGAASGGPQVEYQESDSEAEVEVVDAAAGDSDDDGGFDDGDDSGDEDEEDEDEDGDDDSDDGEGDDDEDMAGSEE